MMMNGTSPTLAEEPHGFAQQHVDPSKLFTCESSSHDILLLIKKYLLDCGLQSTATTLRNECAMFKKTSRQARKVIRESVLEGDWEALRDLTKLGGPVQQKLIRTFLYLVNRQEFFELVNNHENYQAFAHLVRKLKPFEKECKIFGNDFRDLTYLATCRSVTDSPQFRSWEGVALSRQRLARELERMVLKTELMVGGQGLGVDEEEEANLTDFMEDDEDDVELEGGDEQPARLVQLLQQAYAYQIETKRRTAAKQQQQLVTRQAPATVPPYRVTSLLVDFSFPHLPLASQCRVLTGHASSVKCLEFATSSVCISGGGDADLMFWDLDNKWGKKIGRGHTGRVWDVCSNRDGTRAASVSADSTLLVWDISRLEDGGPDFVTSQRIDTNHENDVYSVRFHPSSRSHVLTCGHDRSTKLVDVETNQVIKVFRGHTGSVIQAVFNPVGNLIATGSKDSTIKFFDVISGVCVRTLPPLLGEVTSVQFNQAGDKLLTATKDSTNRLWDIRQSATTNSTSGSGLMAPPVVKFKGHVNSSKSFIRAQFGSTDDIVLSGSENGAVYVWDAVNGNVLKRLLGHQGTVFRANWNRELNLMGSCGEDGTVRIWKSNA